jgi:DNA-binding IclR family transcriptional regulator
MLAYLRKLAEMSDGGLSGHRTVGRIDDVLEVVARRGGLSLSRIAREIDAPISSTRDLLSGLVDRGYLRRDGMAYQLGERPFLLGVLAGRPVPHGLTHEDVVTLSEIAGAPVMLALLIQHTIYYVDHAGPTASAAPTPRVDRRDKPATTRSPDSSGSTAASNRPERGSIAIVRRSED